MARPTAAGDLSPLHRRHLLQGPHRRQRPRLRHPHRHRNGNEIAIDTRPLTASGPATVLTANLALIVPPALTGSYRIGTRIQQSGRTRHLQATGTLLVTPALPPPAIDRSTLGFSGGRFTFTVLGSPGQSVRIEAAETLDDWQGIATRTLDSATWIFSDPDTSLHPKRFYRVVLGP